MSEYSVFMQKKMVTDFKNEFFRKFSYKPLIVISVPEDDHLIPQMTLNELQLYFDNFLPIINNKKILLTSKRRFREIAELRFIYCFLSRQLGFRLKEIGRSLGNKDHTTIIHSLKTFTDLMETSENFKNKYFMVFNYITEAYKSEKNESPVVDSIN